MIGKEVISEKQITLSEMKKLLQQRKKDGELIFEQKVALDYASEFGSASTAKVETAKASLQEIGVDEGTAAKIIDILPKTKDELGLIFEKSRFSLKEDTVKRILDIVAELE